jgi:hypothetical protein
MTTNIRLWLFASLIAASATALSGCGGGASLTSPSEWFSGFSSNSSQSSSNDVGFTVSHSTPAQPTTGPVSASELVAADGSCPEASAPPAPTPVPTTARAPAAPASAAQSGAPLEPERGVTLGMTECQLVALAGHPDHVDLGTAGGDRRLVLTYANGDHPGTYTFVAGRLKIVNAAPLAEKPTPKKRRQRRQRG